MKVIAYPYFHKLCLSIAISFALFGCDASSDETTTNSKPDTSTSGDILYYAQDVIRQSTPTDIFFVDLSNSMESSNDSPVTLTTVMPLNEDYNCDVISQNTNGFTIGAQNAKVCDYRYRVGSAASPDVASNSHNSDEEMYIRGSSATSGDSFAEATVRAAVGESTEQLTPISGLTSSFSSVNIDIPFELNNVGYVLDTSTYELTTVTLPNSSKTDSSATLNIAANTIDYTPGGGIPSGVERILYTYSDGSSVLMGSIDIAVSTDTNTAPTANSIRKTSYIDPDSLETVGKIPYGKQLRFDIAGLISDPDGDTLHLIDIYNFGATTVIPNDANGDSDLFNDTEFDFKSTQPGDTSISYVVSDGKGGVATGIVQGTVAAPYESILSTLIFEPPIMHTDAINADIDSMAQPGNGISSLAGVTTASHNWKTANSFCMARGSRLPTVLELQSLYNDVNITSDLFKKHNWPININYWASDTGYGSTAYHRSVDMSNNIVESSEINSKYLYTSCVDNTPPGKPVLFIGTDAGTEHLFDTRINDYITFGCGFVVDSMSQAGGAIVGGSGGKKFSINIKDVGEIKAWQAYTGFSPEIMVARLYLYNRKGKRILECGTGKYSWDANLEYKLEANETLTGTRAIGDKFINGLEFWIDQI